MRGPGAVGAGRFWPVSPLGEQGNTRVLPLVHPYSGSSVLGPLTRPGGESDRPPPRFVLLLAGIRSLAGVRRLKAGGWGRQGSDYKSGLAQTKIEAGQMMRPWGTFGWKWLKMFGCCRVT
ncbi:hypothetical protein KIL84_002013 [Mauremys mutica]|uniref:Uncharacterized protein n=1 Tax=Mauremys mutica TaxID=74926 RepID=A0A9D4B5G2_9SAUR|nr:hypothetical protein KIL84_002013 [Mauremys mutica]